MKNKQLALEALAKDCEIQNRYVDGNMTCAIGCLALLAGIERSFFDTLHNCTGIHESTMDPVVAAIEEKFGLNRDQQIKLQEANDWTQDVKARRQAVLERIQSFL